MLQAIKIFNAALLALSILIALHFFYVLLASTWPGPYLDYLADIKNIINLFEGRFIWDDLLVAHNNAHRIFLPRLVFYADNFWFGGSNILILITGISCKLLTLYLFNIHLSSHSATEKIFLNLLLVFSIFNVSSIYNIIFSSDIQWDMMIVLCLLSVFLFAKTYQNEKTSYNYIIAGYIFLIAGILSQAGAMAGIFVFVFIAIIHKKITPLVIVILASAIIFHINNLLPYATPQMSEYDKAIGTIIFNVTAVINHSFNLLPTAAVHYFPIPYQYFSIYFIALLAGAFIFLIRNKNHGQNHLFYFAMVFLLMMLIISASRANWRPGSWVVNRYQIIPLMLCTSITFYAYQVILAKQTWWARAAKVTLAVHLLYILSVNHIYFQKEPIQYSNRVLETHANMFYHGVTQKNAMFLWPFVKEGVDPIADPDPFFRKNNLAYYTNKQLLVGGTPVFYQIGQQIIDHQSLQLLSGRCERSLDSPTYLPLDNGAEKLSSPLTGGFFENLAASVLRNTYYLIDNTGYVVGFSYINLDENNPYLHMKMQGIASNRRALLVADVNGQHQLRCHYRIEQ